MDLAGFPEDVPSRDWREHARGEVARTWLSEDLVLQYRPIERLPRWQMSQRVAAATDNPLLRGLRSKILLAESQGFWVLQDRLPGISVRPRAGNWEDSWRLARRHIGGVREALLLLRATKWQEGDCGYETPTIQSYRITQEEVLSRAEFLPADLLQDLPEERQGQVVLSHGDPIIKNILFGEEALLIDWENIALLPESADPLHFLSYALKYAPPARWPEVAEACAPLGDLDPFWERNILWGILRELGAHPSSPSDHRRWAEGLRILRDLGY